VFARGTDSHVYTAMLLNEGYTARAQALAKAAEGLQRRTAASQRRLTKQINEVLASADMAGFAYAEAVACRCACVGVVSGGCAVCGGLPAAEVCSVLCMLRDGAPVPSPRAARICRHLNLKGMA
jgi:hypothetical protein